MAKIKVSELRELHKQIDNIKTMQYKGLEIELKTYLPIMDKLELAVGIYKTCAKEEDGLLYTDNILEEIAKVYLIAQYYTNINLPKDTVDGYDLLISTGIYNAIKNEISDEINHVEYLYSGIVANEYSKHEQRNSTAYIINKTLNELIEKLPAIIDEADDFIRAVSKEVEDFDPEKVKFVQEFLKVSSGGKQYGDKNI